MDFHEYGLELTETTASKEMLSSVNPKDSISIQSQGETQPQTASQSHWWQVPEQDTQATGGTPGCSWPTLRVHQELSFTFLVVEFCFQQEQACRIDLKGIPKNCEGTGELFNKNL